MSSASELVAGGDGDGFAVAVAPTSMSPRRASRLDGNDLIFLIIIVQIIDVVPR